MANFAVTILLKSAGGPQVKADFAGVGTGARAAAFDVQKLVGQMLGFEVSVKGLGQIVTQAFAGFGALAIGRGILQSVGEAQKAFAQLEAGVRSTGGAAGFSAQELSNYASELQRLTGIDDEAISGAEAVLLTFTKIGHEVFPQATKAALDLSTRLGTDLNSAALQIGKALNDPIKGVTSLTRAGVQFSAAQKEIIASLVQSGQLFEAQTIILKELEIQVGGSAEAFRNTLPGALAAVKNALSDVFEVLGGSGASPLVGFLNMIARGLEAVAAHGGMLISILGGVAAGFVSLKLAMWAQAATSSAAAFNVLMTAVGALIMPVEAAKVAMASLNATILANPAGVAAVAIGLLVTGLISEYRAAGDAKKALAELNEVMGRTETRSRAVGIATAASAQEMLKAALADHEKLKSALALQEVELRSIRRGRAPLPSEREDQLNELARIQAAYAKNEGAIAGLAKKLNDAAAATRNKAESDREARIAAFELSLIWEGVEERQRELAAATKKSAAETKRLGEAGERAAAQFKEMVGDKWFDAGADAAKRLKDHIANLFKESNFELMLRLRVLVGLEMATSDFYSAANAAAARRAAAGVDLMTAATRERLDYARQWRESWKTAREVTEAEMEKVKASLLDAAEKERALGELRMRQLEITVDGWATIADFFGNMFGGLMRQIADGIRNVQAAYQQGQELDASGFGGAAGLSGAFAGIFATAAIFYEAYKAVSADIKRDRARKWGDVTSVSVTGGQWSSASYINQAGREFDAALRDLIRQISESLGGVLAELPKITIRARRDGKEFAAYVAGVWVGTFSDAQTAMEQAVASAIQGANFEGLSREFAAALRASIGATLDELEANIDTARTARRARIGDAGENYVGVADRWRQEIEAARRLGLAIDDMVAARDRELNALINNALGIDATVSEQLRSLSSLNAGMAEAAGGLRAQMQQQIDLILAQIARLESRGAGAGGEGGAGGLGGPSGGPYPSGGQGGWQQGEIAGGGSFTKESQAEWEEALRVLRQSLSRYMGELAAIPEALTDLQINVGVFDALYKYLEGNSKYAAQAHKYALMKVEIEFAAIKAQLFALAKWEEFATMFDDAYRAAREQAGKPARGGGGGRQEARQTALDSLADMQARALGEVAVATLEYQRALAQWREEAKAGKLSAAQLAEGERLLREERQQSLRQRAEELAGIGTDFTKRLADGLKFFRELAKIPRGERGMPDWLVKILEGKFLDGMKKEFQQAINEFNGFTDPFLAIEIQANILRQGLEALAAAGVLAGADLAAARAAIEAGVEYQKQKAVLGIFGRIFEYLKDTPEYAAQIKEFKRQELELEFLILEAQLRAVGLWNETTEALLGAAREAARHLLDAEQSANNIADILYQRQIDAAQTMADAAASARDRFRDMLRNIVDAQRNLLLGPQSALSPQQQFQTALATYQSTLALAQAGNPQALEDIVGAQAALLEVAERYFAGGGGDGILGGYAQLFAQTIAELGALALSPEVQASALEQLVQQELTQAANSALQNHQDLVALRLTMQQILDRLPPFAGGFADGGIVPGPTGAARMAIVHGGELIGGPEYFKPRLVPPPVRMFSERPGGGAGSPSYDELVREVRELRRELAALGGRTATATEESADHLERIAQDTHEQALRGKRRRAEAA